ncbi:Rho termination factor N-terminal domain-containing protein, partial [Parafrankia sp. EUN1f]|uniref:Rho termination factor N-terminal domain-containing protein n=1 Tax=Parafrankia sp. EUN1f TaxID=102897 RepID=UPI0001C43E77
MSDTTDVLPDSARESAAPASPVDSPAAAGTTTVDSADPIGSNGNHAASAGSAAAPRRRRSGTGLSAMLLPELQAMASQMGIPGVGRLRKGQLIAAIQNVQSGDAATRPVPRSSAAPTAAADSVASATADQAVSEKPAAAGTTVTAAPSAEEKAATAPTQGGAPAAAPAGTEA